MCLLKRCCAEHSVLQAILGGNDEEEPDDDVHDEIEEREGVKEGDAPEAARSSSKREGAEKKKQPTKEQKAGLFAHGFK